MAKTSTSVHSRYSGVIVSKTEVRTIRDNLQVKMEDLCKALFTQLSYIGEEAVKIARERGSYMDVTGNLRSSISYCILFHGNPVVNGKTERFSGKSGDGGEGAGAAQALLEKLKSQFPYGIVLIVCAGMNYAAEVEHVRHKDVLTSAELRAQELAKKLLDSITQ